MDNARSKQILKRLQMHCYMYVDIMQWVIGILLNVKIDSLNTRADTPMHLDLAIYTMITTLFSIKQNIQSKTIKHVTLNVLK